MLTSEQSRLGDVQLLVRGHWSFSPLVLLLLLPVPIFVLSYFEPTSAYLNWGQPYLLNNTFWVYAATNLAVIACVFLFGFSSNQKSNILIFTQDQMYRLERVTRLITIITFLSYGTWLTIGIIRGLNLELVRDVFSGSNGAIWVLKTTILAPISGVTTWSQLGVVLGPLLVIRQRLTGRKQTRLFASLFIVTLLRAIFFSERLALVEVVVTTAVAYLFLAPKLPSILLRPWKFVLSWIALAACYVTFFATTEFFRSWTFYSTVTQQNIFQFSYDRIIAYYATAFNNGALYLNTNGLSWDPFALIQGNFGLFGLQDFLVNTSEGGAARFTNALWSSSDPEFSNVSGLFLTTSSLGILASWLFWLGLSLLIVSIYRKAVSGSPTSIVAYSVATVGVLEIDRLFYFGQSRTLPVIIALILFSLYLSPPHTKPTAASSEKV